VAHRARPIAFDSNSHQQVLQGTNG